MPLLSLPHEILLDIIDHVDVIDKLGYDEDCFSSVEYWGSSFEPSDLDQGCDRLAFWPSPHSFRYPNITNLAHTCQLLRTLSLPSKYSSTVSDGRAIPGLYTLVTCHPSIAASIRHLTLFVPYKYSSRQGSYIPDLFLQRIVGSCKGLQELCLDGQERYTYDKGGVNATLLKHVAPESRESIVAFGLSELEFKSLFEYLGQLCEEVGKGGFSALNTMRIGALENLEYGLYDSRSKKALLEFQSFLSSWLGGGWDGNKLETVQTFIFGKRSYGSMETAGGLEAMGRCFAMLMPNVQVLSLNTTPGCIYGVLAAYADLGSQLTEVTLTSGPRKFTSFCDVIAKLSPKLSKFVISGHSWFWICHRIFGAEGECLWPQLTLFNVKCRTGCDGIEPELLRAGLERLTQTHPTAYIYMEGEMSPGKLVTWNCATARQMLEPRKDGVSPLEDFEILQPSVFKEYEEEIRLEQEYEEANRYNPRDFDDYGYSS